MSFEEAVSALEGAIETDQGGGESAPAPAPVVPEQAAPDLDSQGESTTPEAAAPAPEAPATEDTFDDGQFNPDLLPDELKPAWKQLQGAYTKKTQAHAERQKELEGLGDLEQIKEAVETYQWLQNPDNWADLHSTLSTQMEALGMTPAQASVEAARQVNEAATAPAAGVDLSQLESDPEMAPVATYLKSLEGRLDTFESSQKEAQLAAQREQAQMAMLGELQRQEAAIREANPKYKQKDIDAVYELSSFFEGNLLDAQTRYEEIRQDTLSEYLSNKEAVAATPGVQTPAGDSSAPSHPAPERPRTLEEGHQAGLAALDQIENLDWS